MMKNSVDPVLHAFDIFTYNFSGVCVCGGGGGAEVIIINFVKCWN